MAQKVAINLAFTVDPVKKAGNFVGLQKPILTNRWISYYQDTGGGLLNIKGLPFAGADNADQNVTAQVLALEKKHKLDHFGHIHIMQLAKPVLQSLRDELNVVPVTRSDPIVYD